MQREKEREREREREGGNHPDSLESRHQEISVKTGLKCLTLMTLDGTFGQNLELPNCLFCLYL